MARHYRQEANEEANYKAIERLLEGLDPKRFLHRLMDTQRPIILADLTEVHRPQAKHTPYVGRLRDGGQGFWVFTLAQPYKGRAIPVHVGLYSQATLEAEGTSRNGVWRRVLREPLEGVEPCGCLTGSSPLGDGLGYWRRRECGTPSGGARGERRMWRARRGGGFRCGLGVRSGGRERGCTTARRGLNGDGG